MQTLYLVQDRPDPPSLVEARRRLRQLAHEIDRFERRIAAKRAEFRSAWEYRAWAWRAEKDLEALREERVLLDVWVAERDAPTREHLEEQCAEFWRT